MAHASLTATVFSSATGYLVFLLVAIVVLSLVYYFSVRLITGEELFEFSYAFRLVLVALITLFVAPVFQRVIPGAVSGIGGVLSFVIILYSVRYLLIEPLTSREEWEKAIWVSVIALVVVYVINYLAVRLLGVSVVFV